ncbi:MAG: tetrahydrodipicolinate N-succinyltransferase N-terminal domain-containing protein [Acidimicrobiia bacterium]
MPDYQSPAAFGIGICTVGPSGAFLDVWYPHVNVGQHSYPAAAAAKVLGHTSGTVTYALSPADLDAMIAEIVAAEAVEIPHPNLTAWRALREIVLAPAHGGTRQLVAAFIGSLDDAPVDPVDGYLRLHMLSTRAVPPHGVNMDGIFGVLTNCVWTNFGPFEVDDFPTAKARLTAEGHTVHVRLVDKFPAMLDYVVPAGVRIADGNRVRLGAHLASGTTVMHEGFCNFNAGTLGASMVEGRISAGVVVDDGSDIGGGASIMGTLSGGGSDVISIGKNCLLGANSGLGISLGDDCIVEAGLYLTAGTQVSMPDGTVVKARDLSGANGLLFRRNSRSGEVEAKARTSGASWQGLNDALHDN